jgi:hypothetical protein
MSIKVTGIKGVLLGAAVGLGLGYWASSSSAPPFNSPWYVCASTLAGGTIGVLAGCLLWWVDKKRAPVPPEAWLSKTMEPPKDPKQP